MPIRDCVPPYRFEEAEPVRAFGCAVAEHPLSCLCDVVLPVPAAVYGGMSVPMPQLAREMLTGQFTAEGFERYMSAVLGIYEYANNILEGGVTVDELEEARSAFLDVWSSQHGDATVKRKAMREALSVYRDAGMSFRQIANHLRTDSPTGSTQSGMSNGTSQGAVSLPTVVRVLNRGDETVDLCYKLALIESHLRQGVDTYDLLVDLTGLSWDAVAHFAQRWGYKTLAQERRAAGHGNKNNADTIAMVRHLRCQGLTPKKILEAVHEALPESRDTLTYHGVNGLIRPNQRRG